MKLYLEQTSIEDIKSLCSTVLIEDEDEQYYVKSFDDIDNLSNYYICLDENSIPLAYAVVYKYDTRVLKRIFVLKDYRKLGIGKFILDHLQIKSLCCYSYNLKGIEFYNSCGFKNVGNRGQLHLTYFEK